MKLNKSSGHARFYQLWWKSELPGDLCNYFWGFLVGIFSLVFFPGRIVYEFSADNWVSYYDEKYTKTSILAKLFLYIAGTVGTVLAGSAIGRLIPPAIIYWKISLGVLVLIIVLIVWFITSPGEVAAEYVKAKKNKLCPKVEWK